MSESGHSIRDVIGRRPKPVHTPVRNIAAESAALPVGRRSRSFGLLAGVFADLGITGTAATGRAITQIPLGPGGTIDFTNVKIALGIGSDHVRPVEHTGFTATAAYPI